MKLSPFLRVYACVLSRFIVGATAFFASSARSARASTTRVVSENNVQSAGGSLSSSTSPVTTSTSRSRNRSTAIPRIILDAAPRDEELFHRSLLAARLLGGSAVANSKKTGGRGGGGGRKSRKKDDCTAYVGNLPYDATELQVREMFDKFGTVTRIYMPTDRDTGGFRGFAFVSMSSRDEMLSATESMDQSSFLGRTISSNESVPKSNKKRHFSETKLYVGNIPFDTAADDLRDFLGQYGTVREVYIPLDRETGSPRGLAFVNVEKDDSDMVLHGANGEIFSGRTLSVLVSIPRGQVSPNPNKKESTKLYVGNLPFSSDAESVRSLFEEYGEVLDCYMPLDRDTGGSRGFAFVTMEPDAAYRAADETDGYEWSGRVLRVNEAQPKGSTGGGSPNYSCGDDGDHDS